MRLAVLKIVLAKVILDLFGFTVEVIAQRLQRVELLIAEEHVDG